MYLWIKEGFIFKFQLHHIRKRVFVVLALPSTRIQHDGPWPGHMGYNSPVGAVHGHGADALVDIITVVDSFVNPVISDAIRGTKI